MGTVKNEGGGGSTGRPVPAAQAAPKRELAYDVTRLFIGPLRPTPRGIDRVDLILARHFFTSDEWNARGLLPTPWGMRLYDGPRILRMLSGLQGVWREESEIEHDPSYVWVRARLLGEDPGPAPFPAKLTLWRQIKRMARMIRVTGIVIGRSAKRDLGTNAAYLNVGQTSLAVPFFFRWLRRRPDVCPVVMLHDVIPLEYPELVPPSTTHFHTNMIKNTAHYARGVIVSTNHARRTVSESLTTFGRSGVSMLSTMLPLDKAFDEPPPPDPALEGVDYFIVVGAIEARKNLLLLLEAWEGLAAKLGDATPQLVLAGSRHHGADEIIARFEASTVASKVHFVTHLSTPGINTLIAGARAVLMPSLAEGFGLPIVEAHALGVPAVASDIPAHREVIGSNGILLPADDAGPWIDTLLDLPFKREHAPLKTRQLRLARRDFLKRVEAFLEEAT